MEEVLTAYDFLDKRYPDFESLDNGSIWDNIEEVMQDFAKLHVEAALKAALENAPIGCRTDVPSYEEMEDAIFNAYPLNNIG